MHLGQAISKGHQHEPVIAHHLTSLDVFHSAFKVVEPSGDGDHHLRFLDAVDLIDQ